MLMKPVHAWFALLVVAVVAALASLLIATRTAGYWGHPSPPQVGDYLTYTPSATPTPLERVLRPKEYGWRRCDEVVTPGQRVHLVAINGMEYEVEAVLDPSQSPVRCRASSPFFRK